MFQDTNSSLNGSIRPSTLPGEGTLAYRDARKDALDSFEQKYLTDLIRDCEGNVSEAARRARMDRSYLLSLLRKHDLR